MAIRTWLLGITRFLLLAAAAVAIVLISAIVAAWIVVEQLREPVDVDVHRAGVSPGRPAGQTVEIDFYKATGLGRPDLEAFLQEQTAHTNGEKCVILLTLQNGEGDYLSNNTAVVKWDSGTETLVVGKSGVLGLVLHNDRLSGLTIVAPDSYSTLKQRSIPLGSAYDPAAEPSDSLLGYEPVRDGRIGTAIDEQLRRIAASGEVVGSAELAEQLRRKSCSLDLQQPRQPEMTPAEIYRKCKRSVVVVATMLSDGRVIRASGFVLHSSGVIATSYHVIDKPSAVSRGVMTCDEKMYPVIEVLAAGRSADVALLRIEAEGLPAVPLSKNDEVGSPVALISHPGSEYFSVTEGVISRYFTATLYGRTTVQMSVTADFADGSSGAPIFNKYGEVAGVVSATRALGDQMVSRFAAPAESVRNLVLEPASDTE